MSVFVYLFLGLSGVALAWWAMRRPSPKTSSPRQTSLDAAPSAAAKPVLAQEVVLPLVPAQEKLHAEPPPELASFQWRLAADIGPQQLAALLEAIQGIPRPPNSLQKLLSPEFVAQANSIALSELVMGEPLIAAKVLAAVNSPLFGLLKPVTGMGQAVTFLGMTTVRNICVQYMLAEAFKPHLAHSQKAFDGIWRASTIASELCARLAKALNLPEQGALSTKVVLGFVGNLSSIALMPRETLDNWRSLGRLERAQLEQATMQLSAGEVGGLLMQSWGLPAELIEGVHAIDRVLVTPAPALHSTQTASTALAYLCARLGERLALGQMDSLEGYNPFADTGPDTFYLNQHLRNPALRQLPAALASAELQGAVQQLLVRESAKMAAV